MKFLFYATQSAPTAAPENALDSRYTWTLWRPSWRRLWPRGLPPWPFAIWWLFHYLRLFANRDYSLLLVYEGKRCIHHTCVVPGYFRFPFMNEDDLQIGYTRTTEGHRGEGLAVFAATKVIQLLSRNGRQLWYVVHETNTASQHVAERSGFSLVGRGRRTAWHGLHLIGAYHLGPPQRSVAPAGRAGGRTGTLNIWLTTIGEPVPVREGTKDRLHRTGYFAHFLADHGHKVTWWTSTFDHFRKKQWFDDDETLQVDERLTIRMLHGSGYRSNVSVTRFRDHAQIARKFARQAREQADRPDIIVSALPTVDLCLASVEFGRERGIPVVADMRDMWPDIFLDAMPRLAKPIGWLLLRPLFRHARATCAKATAITGITEAFVDWGLQRGGRARSSLDRAFYMGYTTVVPPAEELRVAEELWDRQGVVRDPARPIACFVGTLGRQFDLETVLAAARLLQTRGSPVRFVICGRGDRLEHYRRLGAGLHNVVFPGWVDAAAIYTLLRRSAFALDPLPDRYDFLATINNKAIEYMSAGLPVISSPNRGMLADFLARERCGLSYNIGDAQGLADILAREAVDSDGMCQLAENSARVFQEKFTAEKVYGEMMAYLEEIAGSTASKTIGSAPRAADTGPARQSG
jgi:glycosyltransferase involved in cell wall biosynthesis/RimJ/RimL family protein N-acetyltransferase